MSAPESPQQRTRKRKMSERMASSLEQAAGSTLDDESDCGVGDGGGTTTASSAAAAAAASAAATTTEATGRTMRSRGAPELVPPELDRSKKGETREERIARVEVLHNATLARGGAIRFLPLRSCPVVVDGRHGEGVVQLVVAVDIGGSTRGRGIAVVSDHPPNSNVAEFEFTLTSDKEGMLANAHLFSGFSWEWSKGSEPRLQRGDGPVQAMLHTPRIPYLGNLANCSLSTDAGGEKNNCKIVADHINKRLFLRTTTKVTAGSELLTSYSRGYTRALVAATEEEKEADAAEASDDKVEVLQWIRRGRAYVHCPVCNKGFISNRKVAAHESFSPCFNPQRARSKTQEEEKQVGQEDATAATS